MEFKRLGILCVVSGPSGSGKTSLCRAVSGEGGECVYSVSCTTRKPREGEIDGDDYIFLTEEEFKKKAARGEFLEYAEVHGRFYGTLRNSVMDHLERGEDVVMDIDVQGAELVRRSLDEVIGRALVDVFILPPTLDELRERLAGRGTESEKEMAFRLENARKEMRHWREYGYTIVTGARDEDLRRFRAILAGERNRSARLISPGSGESLTEG